LKLYHSDSKVNPNSSINSESTKRAFLAEYGELLAAKADEAGLVDDRLAIVQGHVRGARLGPQAVERLLNDNSAIERVVATRRALADGLTAAAASPLPLPPVLAHAFGVLGSAHEQALKVAVRSGRLGDAAILAFNGDWITERIAAQFPLRFETSVGASRRPDGADHPNTMLVAGLADAPRVIVSNGYELWRATQFKTCEPETIAWLAETFGEGDVLYDVGANIGVVTLIAAMTRDSRVVAFEPEPANFARLTENVRLNARDNVLALPLALGDTSGIAKLNLRDPVPGASAPFPLTGQARGPTADCLIEKLDGIPGLPVPTHIKIDVDGGQRAVLSGATQTLLQDSLRELLIEMFDSEMGDIDRFFARHGFRRVSVYARPVPHGEAVANVIYRRA
jgi:FkbM family methyltransferase